MSSNKENEIIYAPVVLEFVAASAEFCKLIESENMLDREEWVDKMLKILPLMYVKASLLPDTILTDDDFSATFVNETDYAHVENKVMDIMGDENTYLDVFVEDMKYSDRPISAFVSENIADIYQDIRNFVSVYQYNLSEQMNDAIYYCKEHFHLYWGQKLVNVLRPLHAVYIAYKENSDLINSSLDEEETEWN